MVKQYFGDQKHLKIIQPISKIAAQNKISIQEVEDTIESARMKLLKKRKNRTEPLCDKKILVSWNGLTIKAMVRCAIAFKDLKYKKSAEKALSFIYKKLYSDATFYKWRAKHGGMEPSMVKRLRELEEENCRLKRMYANAQMDNEILKEALEKKF